MLQGEGDVVEEEVVEAGAEVGEEDDDEEVKNQISSFSKENTLKILKLFFRMKLLKIPGGN